MIRTRPQRSRITLGLIAVLLPACGESGVGLGLPALSLPSPFGNYTEHWIIGGDDARVVIARAIYPGFGGPFTPGGQPTEATVVPDVAVVDTATLQSKRIVPGEGFDAWSAQSDGQWMAWTEYNGDVLKIRNLDTQVETTHLSGVVSILSARVAAVGKGRVVVALNGAAGSAALVIDAATGEEFILSGELPFGFARLPFDGERLLVVTYPPVDPSTPTIDQLTADAVYEVVTLATGERATIPPGTIGRMVYDAALVGERVIWPESNADFSQTTVFAYALAGGAVETIAQSPASQPYNAAHLAAVGARGLIWEDLSFNYDLLSANFLAFFTGASTQTYTYRPFEGALSVVASHTFSLLDAFGNAVVTPAFVGDHLVYRKSGAGSFSVRNLATGQDRSFDPFGE